MIETAEQLQVLVNDTIDFNTYRLQFSKREREVTTLVLKGICAQEIADMLFISQSTVKNHIQNIFYKANVKNKLQLYNLLLGNPLSLPSGPQSCW